MSIVEWVGTILNTEWVAELWVILLAARFLNLVALSTVIMELTHHPKLKYIRFGLYPLWIYYFICMYITPATGEVPTLASMWFFASQILIMTLSWIELRKVRLRTVKKEKLRYRSHTALSPRRF